MTNKWTMPEWMEGAKVSPEGLDVGQTLVEITIVINPRGESFNARCPAFLSIRVHGPHKKEALSKMVEILHAYINSSEPR